MGQVSDPYEQGDSELGIIISGLPGDLLEPDPGDVPAGGADEAAGEVRDGGGGAAPADAGDERDDDGGAGPGEGGDEALVYDLEDWSELERQAVADRLREAQIAHGWDGTSLEVSPLDEAAVENVLDLVEGESAPRLDDERDLVAYDMSEWDDGLVDSLVEELRVAGIPYAWRDEELFVHADDEDAVDDLVDRVAHPHELAPEPDDGPAGAEVLGDLFVAADRLQRDGEDPDGILALVDLAQVVEGSEPPYGLGAPEWIHLCERVEALSELLQEDDVDTDAVVTSARDLRTALRPYV